MRLTCLLIAVAGPLAAQATSPAMPSAPPPPATKLEAFKPAAGSVVTIGYTTSGRVGRTSVDAREMHDASGHVVRGVVVEVTESQYRSESALVDADELPDLLKGIDALLAVNANPTKFDNFEVRYTTKGDLQITAFNRGAQISYAIQTGRVVHASDFLSAENMVKFRALIAAAQTKFTSP